MSKPIVIGSRGSPLALVQVEEILNLLPQRPAHVLKTFTTAGDWDKTSSLTSKVGDDFFTNTLDHALLKGDVDVTIHSAKDLPQTLAPGLAIVALPEGIDDTAALVGRFSLKDLPAHAKIGTSSTLRQQQIQSIRPDITIVDIRGTISERIDLVNNGTIDALIVATCALKRLGLAHLIKDILPWEGMALQGQLAVVARQGDWQMQNLFQPLDIRQKFGKVILAGAGPGDPELITVKAMKALKGADIIFYDYLADERLLHFALKAEHHFVGKRKGAHSMPQSQLNILLRNAAKQGKTVLRLKGGDPLIFGRGAEEIEYLRSYHIDVEVIPGVSSATGIPSSLAIPLTARDVSSSVAFISAHERLEAEHRQSPIHIPQADTLVFLMGLTKLPQIIDALRANGRCEQYPIMIISKGTRSDEHIVQGTVSTIVAQAQSADIKPPALIIAGNIIGFYKKHQPQKNILYLGTNPSFYRHLGRLIEWPMLNIAPIQFSAAQIMDIQKRLHNAELVIFTSPQSVYHFCRTLRQANIFERLAAKAIATIGAGTTDVLNEFYLSPILVAKEETAKGLYQAITQAMQVKGKQILLPRSNLPNPFLKEALLSSGAHVDELTIYTNTKPAKRPLPEISIDTIIFTSPSTVKHFIEDYGQIPSSWEILAKGPVTHQALKDSGYESKIV